MLQTITTFTLQRLGTVYQLRATIPTSEGIQQAFHNSITTITSYLVKQCTAEIPNDVLQDISSHSLSYDFTTVIIPERPLWAARVGYMDFEEDPIHPRYWQYDLALIGRTRGGLEIGIQVTAEAIPGAPVHFSPILIRELTNKVKMTQGCPISDKPLVIDDPMHVDMLYDLLSAPERTIPVVVISEVNYTLWPYSSPAPMYTIEPTNLARKLYGFAHVVQLSYQAAQEWTTLAGKRWAVYNGAVRFFTPGWNVNRETADSHHPNYYVEDVMTWKHYSARGPEAFTQHLYTTAKTSVLKQRMEWGGLYFLPEARQLKTEIALICRDVMTQADAATNRQLQQKVIELAGTIEGLQEKLESQKEQTMNAQNELLLIQDELKLYQDHNTELQAYIERLTNNTPKEAIADSNQVSFPESYEEIPAWVEQYLAGKLVLLPRAVRAMAKAKYQSPILVAQALWMLANEYRDNRLGLVSNACCQQKCQELGVDITGSITKSRANSEGRDYYVTYPIGTEGTKFLHSQVRKGNSRQQKYCLRIYFLWDEKSEKVIVGHLPSHLSNRAS